MNEEFEEKLRSVGEVGYVEQVMQNVVEVSGLPGLTKGEVVWLEDGAWGQTMTLNESGAQVMLLVTGEVRKGERAARLGQKLAIRVSDAWLGRVVDGLGRGVGGEGELREVDRVPMGIVSRRRVTNQVETGVILVDLLVPIGAGQRQLVLGDRKIGKTHFLRQVMLSQARAGSVCIYAGIGRAEEEISAMGEFFKREKVGQNTVIVAATVGDSAGEIVTSPLTAMTVAEYFRDKGRQVVVVLDDMTTHARFYRELSLLARRFPGRESYPGDMFFVQSRIVERAGSFMVKGEGAAITCLAVAETVQSDMTGFIQTNLMSMTDGHLYFDAGLFFLGRRPAIDPFLSVSRVGHQTQAPGAKLLRAKIFELLAGYNKAQSFARFGAELGETYRQTILLGERIVNFFHQGGFEMVPLQVAVAGGVMLITGIWDGRDLSMWIEKYERDKEARETMEAVCRSNNWEEIIQLTRKLLEKI